MSEEEILFSLSKNQGTYCCTKSKVCQYLPPGDYAVPCCGGSPCSSAEDVGNNPGQVTPFDNYDSFYECFQGGPGGGGKDFGECCKEAGCDAGGGGGAPFCFSSVEPCKSCEYNGGTCYDTEEECICGCNKSWKLDSNTVWPNTPCKCIEVCEPPEPPFSFETEEECDNSLTGTDGQPISGCTGGQPMIADSFGQSNRLEVDYESTNSLSNAKLNENGQISSENAINKENNNTILPKNVSIFL